MSDPNDLIGPYIVWENYEHEGWHPKSYSSLHSAITAQRYNSKWIITKTISYEIKEV